LRLFGQESQFRKEKLNSLVLMRKIIPICALLMLCGLKAQEQTFVIHDELVSSPDAHIIDTEFDPYHNRICWQSDDDKLWVCRLDTTTWALTVPDGMETLIDTALVPIDESTNGGEWGYDQNGTFLAYNKQINKTRYVAIAAETGPTWSLCTLLDAPNRMNPHATRNPEDEVAAIHYMHNSSSYNTKFKFLDNLGAEHTIFWFKDAHWMDGEQILTGILCNGQVGLMEPGICMFPEQITFDTGTVYSLPYMWRAPEKGDLRMFFARANETEIRVFREIGAISGHYALYMSFQSPSSNPEYDKIASPEPIIYEGQSYISFMASSSPDENAHKPAEIWIAKIDSLQPLFRMVSDTSTSIRTDPEPFPSPDSLLVYYTEEINTQTPNPLYRLKKCDTGIGAGIPLGAGENPGAKDLPSLAYPNPFTDHISLKNTSGVETFYLADGSGQFIWTGNRIDSEDFSCLAHGIYFLKIVSESTVRTIKLLKE
jgi:hypothetical protein